MISSVINREDKIINDIINYIFVKQSNFNSYFKTFSKEIKEIRKQVKKVNNIDIKVNYITEENDIKLVTYELINNDLNTINILFIGFEDNKYFDLYKQYINNEYNNYKVCLSSSKFNFLHEELLHDEYFKNINNKKTLEIFETKLNKLKYRMNQDILVFPLENYLNDEFKSIHISKFRKTKNIKNLVVLYNNEMIGYFDYKVEEEYTEIIEYKIDNRVLNKDIVIGKALLYIFDKYGKFKNIKISLIDDNNYNEFIKCGFLLIEEQNIFFN